MNTSDQERGQGAARDVRRREPDEKRHWIRPEMTEVKIDEVTAGASGSGADNVVFS